MLIKGRILIACGVLLAIAMIAGCGGGGGGTNSGDTTGPTISGASAASPSSCAGGDVTIKANVTDNTAVKSVTAVVTDPYDKSSSTLTMSLTTGSTFSCSGYEAAENGNTSSVTYTVVITATDTAGNTSKASCTFKVPGETPPSPPSFE
ncbi:MAG: hypothetical protein ABFD83_12960 [Armatimonadota bacterium]